MTSTLDHARTEQSLPFGQLLGRVVLAGLIAGGLAGLFSLLVTERAIAPALELEEARAAAEGATPHHGEELFSRGEQLVGGFLGTVAAGIALAVVFAAVYALIRHRMPGRTDVTRTAVLAAIGFGIFGLLPALKIPANPPAVGDPETVSTRTAIYGAVLLLGVITVMLVAALVSALRSRGTGVAATAVAATVATGVLLALILVLVPDNPDTIAADVPTAVVWDFRLASLGQLAVLWSGLGLASGWLLDRLVRPPGRCPVPVPPTQRCRRDTSGCPPVRLQFSSSLPWTDTPAWPSLPAYRERKYGGPLTRARRWGAGGPGRGRRKTGGDL
jgi:predicted cobalt transporter CbtA